VNSQEVLAPESTVEELLEESARSSVNGRHLEGAEQAEQVLARPDVTATQQAHARELLAQHRLRLGEFEASVEHGLQAVEYLTSSGDFLRLSKVHCTLALAFHEAGLNEPALRHVLGALEAARASGSPLAEFWALSRSSMVHVGMGDGPRAMELSRQALALSQTLGDPEASFAGLNNTSDTCLEFARIQRAQGLSASLALQEALARAREAVAIDRIPLPWPMTVGPWPARARPWPWPTDRAMPSGRPSPAPISSVS
jgi:ATP/maltotriose-dependent transcriptional regulator MalT